MKFQKLKKLNSSLNNTPERGPPINTNKIKAVPYRKCLETLLSLPIVLLGLTEDAPQNSDTYVPSATSVMKLKPKNFKMNQYKKHLKERLESPNKSLLQAGKVTRKSQSERQRKDARERARKQKGKEKLVRGLHTLPFEIPGSVQANVPTFPTNSPPVNFLQFLLALRQPPPPLPPSRGETATPSWPTLKDNPPTCPCSKKRFSYPPSLAGDSE